MKERCNHCGEYTNVRKFADKTFGTSFNYYCRKCEIELRPHMYFNFVKET